MDRFYIGLIVVGVLFLLWHIGVFDKFLNEDDEDSKEKGDEGGATDAAGTGGPSPAPPVVTVTPVSPPVAVQPVIVSVDPLAKYTKGVNGFGLVGKYYPDTKEWQEVKQRGGALLYAEPGLCATECDKYPNCKAFFWNSNEGACFLGPGYNPNGPYIGDYVTTYYKS